MGVGSPASGAEGVKDGFGSPVATERQGSSSVQRKSRLGEVHAAAAAGGPSWGAAGAGGEHGLGSCEAEAGTVQPADTYLANGVAGSAVGGGAFAVASYQLGPGRAALGRTSWAAERVRSYLPSVPLGRLRPARYSEGGGRDPPRPNWGGGGGRASDSGGEAGAGCGRRIGAFFRISGDGGGGGAAAAGPPPAAAAAGSSIKPVNWRSLSPLWEQEIKQELLQPHERSMMQHEEEALRLRAAREHRQRSMLASGAGRGGASRSGVGSVPSVAGSVASRQTVRRRDSSDTVSDSSYGSAGAEAEVEFEVDYEVTEREASFMGAELSMRGLSRRGGPAAGPARGRRAGSTAPALDVLMKVRPCVKDRLCSGWHSSMAVRCTYRIAWG